MICPKCNAQVDDSMRYCEYCGAALPASSAQQPVTPQQDGATYQQPNDAQQQVNRPYDVQQTAAQPVDAQGYAQQPTGQPYDAQQPYGAEQFGQQPYGAPPASPGVYATPNGASAQASSTPFVLAIIALVTGFLGIFPVSIVLAIVALVKNSGQRKRGEFSTKQTPTTVMSVISLVVSAIMLVLTLMLGGFVAAYLASSDTGASAVKTSTSAHVSSSSAQSASSASNAASSTSAESSNNAGGAVPANDVAQKLVGNWKLTELVSDGEVAGADDIQVMESLGLTVSLEIREDGTASLVLFGVNMSGPWECTDGTNVRFVLEGGAIDATVDGNTLTMLDGNDVLTFTKQ